MSSAYTKAATAVEGINEHKFGIKGANITSPAVFAIVSNTLKYFPIIVQLIETTGVVPVPSSVDVDGKARSAPPSRKKRRKGKGKKTMWFSLVVVMICDLLFGEKKKIVGGGVVKQNIMKFESRLNEALVRLKMKKGVMSNEALVSTGPVDSLPVYARINQLVIASVDASVSLFPDLKYGGVVNPIDIDWAACPQTYFADEDVDMLLIFNPEHKSLLKPLVANGALVIQQKASCFSAFAVSPPRGAACMDVCSAPGNKATHLAAIVGASGSVLAVEMDARRFQVLKQSVNRARADRIVKCVQSDFLQIDPEDHPEIGYVVLDPSCSGSGLVERYQVGQEEHTTERLQSLAAFQLRMLIHALSFPGAERVVYSTCSVHEIENESVVSKALESNDGQQFRLVPALPKWKGRGLPPYAQCVRVDPQAHRSIGFFVAMFERIHWDNNDDDQ